MRSQSDAVKRVDIQRAAQPEFGLTGFHTADVRRLILFGILSRSNEALRALKCVNRTLYHIINDENQRLLETVIPLIKPFFQSHPQFNLMSFNIKARYIPVHILTDMVTNTSRCPTETTEYILNECNLKAFFLGTKCEDQGCKDCDKNPEIIERHREGHQCERKPCSVCNGSYDLTITKSVYSNTDCLILGAQQEVLLSIVDTTKTRKEVIASISEAYKTRAISLACMTQNIPFICWICESLESDESEALKRCLGPVLSSNNSEAILQIEGRLPESRSQIAEHNLLEVLKNPTNSAEQVLSAIKRYVNLLCLYNPQKSIREIIQRVLTSSYRLEILRPCERSRLFNDRPSYTELYVGPLLHCVAMLQTNSEVFEAVWSFYREAQVSVSDATLTYQRDAKEVEELTLMNCAVSTRNLEKVSLLIPHVAFTSFHVRYLSNHYQILPLQQMIFTYLRSEMKLDAKQQLITAYLTGLKEFDEKYQNSNHSEYLCGLAGVIAHCIEWGELTEKVNQSELLKPYDAQTCANVLCNAAMLGWNPDSEAAKVLLRLLPSNVTTQLRVYAASEIYANREMLQFVLSLRHSDYASRVEIYKAASNNHQSSPPRLLSCLVMALLAFNSWQDCSRSPEEYIREAREYYSTLEIQKGFEKLTRAAEFSGVKNFDHFEDIVNDNMKSRCTIC